MGEAWIGPLLSSPGVGVTARAYDRAAMSATCHVPPAPPATTCLAVAAVLTALVAAGGAGLADAAAEPVAGVGVLAALVLAVPAGWWLAPRVTPARGAETEQLRQAEARALAGRLCGDTWRVWVGAVVGGPVLLATAGWPRTVALSFALGLAALGGLEAAVAALRGECESGSDPPGRDSRQALRLCPGELPRRRADRLGVEPCVGPRGGSGTDHRSTERDLYRHVPLADRMCRVLSADRHYRLPWLEGYGHGMSVTVLVVDGQALFAGALAGVLEDRFGFDVIDERPETAADAVDAARRHRPDVVLLEPGCLTCKARQPPGCSRTASQIAGSSCCRAFTARSRSTTPWAPASSATCPAGLAACGLDGPQRGYGLVGAGAQ